MLLIIINIIIIHFEKGTATIRNEMESGRYDLNVQIDDRAERFYYILFLLIFWAHVTVFICVVIISIVILAITMTNIIIIFSIVILLSLLSVSQLALVSIVTKVIVMIAVVAVVLVIVIKLSPILCSNYIYQN